MPQQLKKTKGKPNNHKRNEVKYKKANKAPKARSTVDRRQGV